MKKILILLIGFSLIACGKRHQGMQGDGQAKTDSNSIHFTTEQIDMSEIKLGKMEKKILSPVVECHGVIQVPPQGLASVSAPYQGFVEEANFMPGQFVQKGSVLAVLKHADYIQLQMEYLSLKGQLQYYSQEYKRQGELTLDNASSMKKMQMAESDYKSNEARFMALGKQLKFIGIDPDQLTVDNITSSIKLLAPVSGYITQINANLGKFVEPQQVLYEMIDNSHMHLNLKVYEKDVFRLHKSQSIQFSLVGQGNRYFTATIETVGHKVDADTRTIDVLAHIQSPEESMMPGMYVNATIDLSHEPVACLPVTALVRKGSDHYIFYSKGDNFVRLRIAVGTEQNEYVQLLNLPDSLTKEEFVIKGAYYISDAMDRTGK